MSRYFLEVSYKGNNYSGFQKQENANSIQGEVEKAMGIFYRTNFDMTCSSRTDTGVHALQNFFHFDFDGIVDQNALYHINSILPSDIVVTNFFNVKDDAHCRFDAISRSYRYYIFRKKNPFLRETAHYFPYTLDMEKLNLAAQSILKFKDFTAFSKRKTQVKTFECSIMKSEWIIENDCVVYAVEANRFLRGMVRGLVGTMLHVGRGKMNIDEFKNIVINKDSTKADFSVPGHGLFLMKVNYDEGYF